MDFVDGGAGQQPLFLFVGQGLLYAVDVLPAGGLGKGGIELFNVIGAQLLRLLFGLETFPSLAGFTQAPSLSERSTAA